MEENHSLSQTTRLRGSAMKILTMKVVCCLRFQESYLLFE